MDKRKPILLEIDAVHPCWCIESAKDEGVIRGLNCAHTSRDSTTGVYELRSPKVDELISSLRRHKWVKDLQVLSKGKDYALVNVRSKADALMYERILKTDTTPLLPSFTGEGHDTLAMVVPSDKALRKLYSTLKDDFDIKLRSKKYFEPLKANDVAVNVADFLHFRTAKDLLSTKQLEAFVLANRYGYFETPKRVSLQELADMTGIKQSAFSEHLRKAEAKLLPFIAEVMGETKRKSS